MCIIHPGKSKGLRYILSFLPTQNKLRATTPTAPKTNALPNPTPKCAAPPPAGAGEDVGAGVFVTRLLRLLKTELAADDSEDAALDTEEPVFEADAEVCD